MSKPPGIPGNTGFLPDTAHVGAQKPGSTGGGGGKAHPPKVPVAKGSKLDPDEVRALGAAMIGQLDTFLDEVAEGHRHAMDATVEWLTGYGDLDREIQRSVDALSPLLQKWSIEICFLLRMKQTLRFNELKDALPGIGSRTLSQRLKELEAQGIVERKAFAEVPVRVEYKLSPKGMRMGDLFLPVIAHLRITGWREGLEKRTKVKA
ncbi:MAG TPA: helix-turn-helix domain-containing protein [Candidatus Thermoplasmatota archaeon]|nr:helix-turn-helix domain-containing protein [Candidatus Thermoplasmatota archaeon]